MNRSQTTFHALLALLMVTTLLPVGATTTPEDAATDPQETAINALLTGNSGPKGASNLQGDWQVRNELHQLFFRDPKTLEYTTGGTCGANPNPQRYQYLYDPVAANAPTIPDDPTTGPGPAVDQAQTWTLNEAVARMEITSLTTTLFLQSSQSFRVDTQILVDGVAHGPAVPVSMGGVVPTSPVLPGGQVRLADFQPFTGTMIFPTPVVVQPGEEIAIRLTGVPQGDAAAGTSLDMSFNCNSANSNILLGGDFARVNLWTENRQKVQDITFSAPDAASTQDRGIVLRVAHINALGEKALGRTAGRIQVSGPGESGTLVYYDNANSAAITAPQGQRWAAVTDSPADGIPSTTSPGVRFTTFDLIYPESMDAQGEFKATLLPGGGQSWTAITPIVIGGAGSALAPSVLDQAVFKTILIGERTTFRVTVTNANTASSDTLVLQAIVGNNPAGWSASASPSQIELAPGAQTDAVVTVVPSSLGRNGDQNTITVTATSLNSGAVSNPLLYTVKLNATRQNAACLEDGTSCFRVSSAIVDIGPGGTRVIPFGVFNGGNARDRYILSIQGAPAGWAISTNPSVLDVEAQSLGASVLRLQAPADAPRNLEFDLTLKVVRADDATKSDSFGFNVRVFPLQKFTFQAFTGVDAAGNPTYTTSTSVDAPLIHVLRDEGPDANLNVPTCSAVSAGGACIGTTGTAPTGGYDADTDADKDNDQSTLFRIVLRNEGDLEDTIRVTPRLATTAALGYQDLDGCEEPANTQDSGGDGLNDGWRVRLIDPAQPLAPFPGRGGAAADTQNGGDVIALGGDFVVPARSAKVLYIEMGWHIPDTPIGLNEACNVAGNRVQGTGAGSRVGDPAPGHAVSIEAISLNDPSQRNTHVLNARLLGAAAPGTPPTRIASQRYNDQSLGVLLHAEDGTGLSELVAASPTPAGRTTLYDLRAVNQANEMDTIRFTMRLEQSGWRYSFQGIDRSLAFDNRIEGHGAAPSIVGRIAGCTAPAVQNPSAPQASQVLFFDCTLGMYDEVKFQVAATAPEDGILGTSNTILVRASSLDSASRSAEVFDTVQLMTTLTGTHVFNLLPDATPANVGIHPGQSAALPFTIRNTGTSSDDYTLTLADAVPAGWAADFSAANPVFVPAGHDVTGFLLVRAPASLANAAVQTFRIQAQSMDSPAVPRPADFVDLKVQGVTDPAALTLAGNPLNVIGEPDGILPLNINATKGGGATNTATGVTFTLDSASLPPGWTRVSASGGADSGVKTDTFDAGGFAEQTFHVRIPADALGTSRAAIRFTGVDDKGVSDFAFVGVSLASATFGVNLTAPGGTTILVAPGSPLRVPLRVENLGVNQDTVNVTLGNVPTEWTAALDTGSVPLQPLDTGFFNITVTAPATLAAGESRIIRVTARTSDLSQTSIVDLTFTTGTSIPKLVAVVNGTLRQAPQETFRFTVAVTNNGTLGDDLVFGSGMTGAFKDVVKLAFNPAQVSLEPAQTKDVSVEVTLPAGLAPGLDVPVIVEARSKGPFLKAVGTTTVPVKVLDYKTRDVDGDLVNEYAVDRDLVASNGYEQFIDPSVGAGNSTAVDAVSMLNAAAQARNTVVTTDANGNSTSVLRYLFDPDGDQKTDLLVDTDADGKPNVYWDPDRGYSHVIPVLKDVTKDGIADYFFDLDGEGGLRLDVYYDPIEGRTGRLLQIDIDNNGVLDYVVDTNGNSQPDATETVLFGGPEGSIASIRESVDVDGDGKVDTVIDSNGDGDPDYFIPNGKTAGVAIVLEDVDGDGIADWTYDSDGDGRRDAYYNPATGNSGFLDTKGDFFSQLKEYWYIGALFGVVLVLFVVLLLVTRK